MSQTILFASGKGGVGKSTLCLHLAGGLARRGRRVLVVETACGFRGLDTMLGLPGDTVYDLSDALEGRCSLGEAIRAHEESELRLMPAPSDPDYLPGEEKLDAFFHWGREAWDFFLVDCATGFSPFTRRMARRCGRAVLVTAPEEVSARCTGRLSALLAQEGLLDQRLVIDRLPREFVPTPSLRDLDDVIDLAGARLLGVVPEQPGLPPPGDRPPEGAAGQALEAITHRLLGERVELTL